MAVKAVSFKNWCEENITPQAWPRILLRCLNQIKEEGYTLKDFQEPSDTIEISENLIEEFNKAMQELYEMQVEQNSLV